MLLNCPGIRLWHNDVPKSLRWPTLVGLCVLAVWLFGFGVWAGIAPLSGAVVSSGSFVATGQNKMVQHLEGGIVRDILVKEGDFVEKGQKLMRLDDTSSTVRLRRLEVRNLRLAAIQARLYAEILGKEQIEFPEDLLKHAADPEIAEILTRQRNELTARRARATSEVAVFEKEIAGLEESIQGFQALVKSTVDQIKSYDDELVGKAELLRRSLVRKAEVLQLQRNKIRLDGEHAQLLSRIGDNRERIARANQQIASARTKSLQVALEELRPVQTEIDDVKEQMRAARDVLDRVEIVSPVRGVVVKLVHNTTGGVVPPGATIMELLPINEELILEARILPAEIVHVREGQELLVRLSALNQRRTPMVEGRVVYVSADAVGELDPRKLSAMPGGNLASFVVRVRLDPHDLDEKVPGFRPSPGLPADIFIKTGDRTFFQYLLKPVLDSFTRAFREQ